MAAYYGNPGVLGTAGLGTRYTGNPGVLGTAGAKPLRPVASAPVRNTASKPPNMTAEEWAREQAQRYIDGLLADIESQRTSYLDELQKRSQLEAQRGQALAEALQQMNLPAMISQIYGNAGDDISGYAKGFSGSLQNTAQADAAQQTRMVSGTGQEGAVRNQGENMGNVLYGVGGYIPARTMAETGAAFASQAALEPSFAARIGQEKAASAFQEGLGGLDEFSKAIADATGQRFGLEQDLLKQRQSTIDSNYKQYRSEQDAIYKRFKDQRDFYIKQQYLAQAAGDNKRADKYLALAREREQRMVEHEQRMTAQAQGMDMNGNLLPGYKLDKNGNVVKAPTAASKTAAAKTAKTNSAKLRQTREDEYRNLRTDALKEAEKLVTRADIVAGVKVGNDTFPPYQVAFRKLWELYKDWLRFGNGSAPKLRARLTQAIDAALQEAGFVKPGNTPARGIG